MALGRNLLLLSVRTKLLLFATWTRTETITAITQTRTDSGTSLAFLTPTDATKCYILVIMG